MKVKGLLLIAILFIVGCSKPLPDDKLDYAGHWLGPNVELIIFEDGSVIYEYASGGVSTSINGPIQEFTGNSFDVGFGPISSTFVVSQPPMQLFDGRWQMIVDGVSLERVD